MTGLTQTSFLHWKISRITEFVNGVGFVVSVDTMRKRENNYAVYPIYLH